MHESTCLHSLGGMLADPVSTTWLFRVLSCSQVPLSSSWLTFSSLLCFAALLIIQTKPSSEGMRPAREKNKPKESCCACHLLSWQEQDVNFCKGSCSKKSVPQAWQERRGQQRLNGGLICKRPWVELVLFPSATCLRVCLIISAYSESFLFFHSDLNTVL